MEFGEKLDFLMRITDTTNSALSRHIKLDPSHISRLRRGERGALKDPDCIQAISIYFARHCRAEYQKKALRDVMEISPGIQDENQFSEIIARWLTGKPADETLTIRSFLTNFASAPLRHPAPAHPTRKYTPAKPGPAKVSVFLGIEGKRHAVLRFLNLVIGQADPGTLLLFSDEPTDWMTSDRFFAAQWATLMFQSLKKGTRILIIHTVSRDLGEMLHAITQWMPLYMSGRIEPYYYPKKRDGVFKRTLFIAPGVAAIASSSVGSSAAQAANLLFRDPGSIQAYEREFHQYLSLCKPLMRIFSPGDEIAYQETLLAFESQKNNSLIKTESLSLLTMPESVLAGMVSRTKLNRTYIMEQQIHRIDLFEDLLKTHRFSEIIHLPDIDSVLQSRVKASVSIALNGSAVFYKPEEFLLHLEHLVFLLQKHENFHVYLTQTRGDERCMVYSKEGQGVMVAKTSDPPVVLSIHENGLSAAFWDFLKNIVGEKAYREPDKAQTLETLTGYLQDLRQAMK
ncbi:MAG: hypothetical protein VB086_10590 [Clostridiaceae bacterium]|nr:hypothetical protein [Clostridiaceae bacterium]